MIRFTLFSAVPLLVLAPAMPLLGEADREGLDFFERKIRPVLVEHCYECHSSEADTVQGGLVLDYRDAMRRGGDSGPLVVPGKPDKSAILDALRFESVEMPPAGRLSDEVIRNFETWITMGAPDPREAKTRELPESTIDIESGREFWSFQPPQRHTLPEISSSQWPQQPIDYFVLHKLDSQDLRPSEAAERNVLLRRLSFDLIGLPPSPELLDSFANDQSAGALGRLVDQLLGSPAFGERWGRMWMDVMRFAEDQAHIVGNNRSLCYPNAYMYRDWLLDALNDDMPYDEFVRVQLAADLLYPENLDSHVALGFIGLGPKYYRRGDLEVMADEWEDRVDTVSRGLLGLTVACARCHDHKFDPVTTQDYYALAGVFANTQMFNRPLPQPPVEKTADAEAKQDSKKKNKQKVTPEKTLHIVKDVAAPKDINVMIRGDAKNLGPVAPRRFIAVLCSSEPKPLTQASGRAQLADAIACRDNPLVARVIVNRVWAQLFGQPIVSTPSNFGSLGAKPSHPKLLDDLSVRFMENGWSLKWLIREMALSSTYQQCSEIREPCVAVDPDNTLLWRMPRRRLSVEQYRDALLTVTGRIDLAIGGPSIKPDDPKTRRRSVYSEVSRLEVNPMLARFDFPDPNAHSAGRVETTTPLQKLFLLNSPMMVAAAETLATRIQNASDDPTDQITQAYRLLYGRSPTNDEIKLGLSFVRPKSNSPRWTDYCQALLAANEMFMID